MEILDITAKPGSQSKAGKLNMFTIQSKAAGKSTQCRKSKQLIREAMAKARKSEQNR
jgi:hypothetical protein